jgi:hypothetical protein
MRFSGILDLRLEPQSAVLTERVKNTSSARINHVQTVYREFAQFKHKGFASIFASITGICPNIFRI